MAGYNLDEKSGLFGMAGIKSPQKVLKNADVAELKHYYFYESVKVILTDVKEKIIKVIDTENKIQNEIVVGDYVVLEFSSSGEKCLLNGRISAIDSSAPFEATINVNKIEKVKDLRKSDKVYVSLKGELKIIGVTEPKPCQVKGLSFGGVKIDCTEDIMMEDIIDVTIKLNKVAKFTFKGKVVRKNKENGFFEYGIEIIELTESNSKALYDFTYNQLNA